MAKQILVIGAGRSATSLIDYLGSQAGTEFTVHVCDQDGELAQSKVGSSHGMMSSALNLDDELEVTTAIQKADVIVSLAPAILHPKIARKCVDLGKHLVTASYVSPEMTVLHEEAQAKGITLLNEIGCDPGIDHMSAMSMIAQARSAGGKIERFFSATGGLVAPKSDTHPWHYKFSWNPRNVILAGQGTAQYLAEGKVRYLPYHRLFAEAQGVNIPNVGKFDAYANRDSLPYIELYGIPEVSAIERATLRYPTFCQGWDILVQLGATSDLIQFNLPEGSTVMDYLSAFFSCKRSEAEGFLANFIERNHPTLTEEIHTQFAYLGAFDGTLLPKTIGTSAEILQALLETKWALASTDTDYLVMHHELIYSTEGQRVKLTETLALEGEDSVHTAMAKTVGLPAALGALRLLRGQISATGVVIPTLPEIYEPILKELSANGISFSATKTALY